MTVLHITMLSPSANS